MFSLSRSKAPTPAGNVAVGGAKELIERHYGVVYNLAYRTMGRREDAEDIAQQTFERALPRLADLRNPEAVGPWLCRIAGNLCLDELRRRQQAQELVEPDLDGLPDADPNVVPDIVAERREVRAAVWLAALSLPHQQRLALALREWQDLSYKQIAETLEISVQEVESILFRARQGFRRAYRAGAQPWPANQTCTWIVGRLSASVDQKLRAGEQARIDAHLPRCATCQFAARELRATKRLYGLMPLAGAPAGAQLAALMAVPAVGVAPVIVAGFSGASAGGMLVSLGAVKVGFGTAAALVGSVLVLLMGSGETSGFASAEAALAAAPPVARTTVTVPPPTTPPVAEGAVVGARDLTAAESAPSVPPRPVAELAHLEPLRIAPDVRPAQGQVSPTPIARETSGVSGRTTGPVGSRSPMERTRPASPVWVISTPAPADERPSAQPPVSEDPTDDQAAPAVPDAPDQEKPDRSAHPDRSVHPDGGNPPAESGDGAPPNKGVNENGDGKANLGGNDIGNSGMSQNAPAGSPVSHGQTNAPDANSQGNGVTPPGQTVSQNPPGQAIGQSAEAPSPNPSAVKKPSPATEAHVAPSPAAPAGPAGQSAKAGGGPAAQAGPTAPQTKPAAAQTAPATQSAGPGAPRAPGETAKPAGASASPAQGAGGAKPPNPAGK
ncbi:MAG TPA: sigma-70 family RNA polymerase sigma factor [Chloroflexota bacterium]